MKYDNVYSKVNGVSAKIFGCNAPAYSYPLFKKHKLTTKRLLNFFTKKYRFAFYNLLET